MMNQDNEASMQGEMTPVEKEQPGSMGMDKTQGGIKKLITSVGQGLGQLAQLVQDSPEMTDQDKQAMQDLMSTFIDFVENKLQDNGQNPKATAPPSGQVGMNEQSGAVPMTNQMKQ